MDRQSDSRSVQTVSKKRGQITKRLIKSARNLRTTSAADVVTTSDTATNNISLTKGAIPNVTVGSTSSRSDKKPNRRRGKHRLQSYYRRTEPETSLTGSSRHPARSPLLVERSKGQIDLSSLYPSDSVMLGEAQDLVRPSSMHSRSTMNSPCDTYPHLSSSTGLKSRSYPKPLEDIGQCWSSSSHCRTQRSCSESMLTTSLNTLSEISLPMSKIEKFSYSTNSRPTVSPLKSSPPRPTRQLKISSFLSPKKSQDSPLLGDMCGDRALSLTPVSLVNASLREAPGYRDIPPIIDHSLSDFQSFEERIPLRGATPMPTTSSHKSVFSRLDSPTKYRQTSLQFSSVPPRKSSTYSQRLDNHLDILGEYDGGSQPGRGLSTLTSVLGTDNDLLHDRLRQQRSSCSNNVHTQRQDFTYSSLSSNQLANIEPDLKLKPDDSTCLYQSRSCEGLNVPKLLNNLTSKSYGTCRSVSQPSTSFAHVAPPNNCNDTCIVTQDRSVKIVDSTLPVQISESNAPTGLTPRSILTSDNIMTLCSGASGSKTGDVRYVQDSSRIHIPVSQLGLKVVAIDCEMVGCIDLTKQPPEQVLANKMLRFGNAGTQHTKKNDIGGVLMKTKMKPVAPKKKSKKKPNKELSIAARCSIIGYDDSVLYDKYINPTVGTDYKIINYRTPWSGIAPRHMTGAIPFHVARDEILDIISDCIVVGHNVSTDFRSLEIHNFPASQIRDTSFNTNLKKRAGLPSNNQPGALKKMALVLLERRIQTRSRVGHCSVEDATATMDLYKLEEIEWENGCDH